MDEDGLIDRLIDAITEIQDRAGSDGSGRYLARLEASAEGLERIVAALPEGDAKKKKKKKG